MAQRKTYCIAAYNHKAAIDEILPATFTARRTACEAASKMKRLGARNVRVKCDQTKQEITIL